MIYCINGSWDTENWLNAIFVVASGNCRYTDNREVAWSSIVALYVVKTTNSGATSDR